MIEELMPLRAATVTSLKKHNDLVIAYENLIDVLAGECERLTEMVGELRHDIREAQDGLRVESTINDSLVEEKDRIRNTNTTLRRANCLLWVAVIAGQIAWITVTILIDLWEQAQ